MPGGRPTLLNAPVPRRAADGTTTNMPVSEVIIERIRAGGTRDEAASSAGVRRQTFHNWLRRGATARRNETAGLGIPAAERPFIAFVDAIEQAEATAVLADWGKLGQMAVGGLPVTTTTVTEKVDADGRVLERSTVTRTEHTLPSVQALTWRLSHRWPQLFSDRLELTGAGGGPIELEAVELGVRARELAEEAQRFVEASQARALGPGDGTPIDAVGEET